MIHLLDWITPTIWEAVNLPH